jgi:putative acetyltransferase
MIRRYRDDDLEDVLRAWERATALGHPFLPTDFMVDERGRVTEIYLPAAETWVWEAEGRVVGFISLLGDEIGGLFVDPAVGRGGIGRSLVEFAGSTRDALEVRVFAANRVGRAFYEKCGFTLIGSGIHSETAQPELRLRLAPTRREPRYTTLEEKS